MSWTRPKDLQAQLQRLWQRGELARAVVSGEGEFPRRLVLRTPTAREISEQFEAVRHWAAELAVMPHLRLEWRELRHRVQGRQNLPRQAWIDSLDDALALTGKISEAKRLSALSQRTRQELPQAHPWIERYPLRALEHAPQWPALLSVVRWIAAHPRPDIYLRQVDIPGVDSKFIEAHRGLLADLLDEVLDPAQIDPQHRGVGGFAARYGFRDKPLRIRLRVLDPDIDLLPGLRCPDLTLTAADFARLNPPVAQVFITENETNFLAFPACPQAIAIFGAGYGWDALARATWLHDCALHYWGDIDTHGFAILDALRRHFPQAASLLMDHETLLAHRAHWGTEQQPLDRDLARLTPAESELYDRLRQDRLQTRLRLEQERIGFGWVSAALGEL